MQPAAWPEPDPLVAAAIAAKYRGKRPRPLAVQIRDQLGQWLDDEEFASVFGIRGRPGWSPSLLALVTVLQPAEKLTDRAAADAVRNHLDWQYLLGLPLDDPGFDSVLAEFRAKVAEGGLEQVVWTGCWNAWPPRAAQGRRQAAHRLHARGSGDALLNRLELAGELVRAALEALSAAQPHWLEQRICVPDFTRRYGTPMTSAAPQSQKKRDELAIAYARDGYGLLEAVYHPSSPPWLRELPAVDVLRRVLVQNYARVINADGTEVIKRREKAPEGDGLPPGHPRSPHRMTRTPGGVSNATRSGSATSCTSTETCDDAPACDCCPQSGTNRNRNRTQTAGAAPSPGTARAARTGVPEPDHQRGDHRRDHHRQPDDRRHPRPARRTEPAPRTALRRLRVPVRRGRRRRARHLGRRADRPAARRHLRAGPRRQRLRPRRLHRRLRRRDGHLPARQDLRVVVSVHPARPGRSRGHLLLRRLRALPRWNLCTTSSKNRRQLTILPRELAEAQQTARTAKPPRATGPTTPAAPE